MAQTVPTAQAAELQADLLGLGVAAGTETCTLVSLAHVHANS